MNNYEKNYFNLHPQNLCLMCGKGCRVMALDLSQDELLNLAEKGDAFVKEFLEIFVPCDNVETARKIDAKTVDDILIQMKNKKNTKDVTFYHCKYLHDDRNCEKCVTNTIRKNFPTSPCSVIPSGCVFTGLLFLKQEEEKQRVRKAKEELLDLAVLKTKIKNKVTLERIETVEKKLNKTIELYQEYGSDDW